MDDEKRAARRKLLAEIERGWETPKPSSVRDVGSSAEAPPSSEGRSPPSPELQDALDVAAARLIRGLDSPPISVPTMDELDSGWGDEEEEDEEEEEEVVEPELPDEHLDPVAYAEAKKARDERIEARRVKKKEKADSKKARRKARAEAARAKQKGKTKKARSPAAAKAAKVAKAKAREDALQERARRAANRAAGGGEPVDEALESGEDDHDDDTDDSRVSTQASAKAPPSRLMKKPMLSGTNTWMLAIALVVFVAAAIFAAVIAR